jgi:hypothetical protein
VQVQKYVQNNMSSVKMVMLVWDILEQILFLHYNARSLPRGRAQQQIMPPHLSTPALDK